LGGSLYLLVAEIDIPASTSVAELEAQIKQVAEDLGVGASLRPAESDDL